MDSIATVDFANHTPYYRSERNPSFGYRISGRIRFAGKVNSNHPWEKVVKDKHPRRKSDNSELASLTPVQILSL